jgi:N-acetylmuramoyl-L-alanine amidase CwlA
MSKNLDSDTFSSRAKQHRKTFGVSNNMTKAKKGVKNLHYIKKKYEPKTPINENYKTKDIFKISKEQTNKKSNLISVEVKNRTRERSTVISKNSILIA